MMPGMEIDRINARFAPVKRSKTFSHIVSTLQLDKKRVLDIGCGFGEHLVNFGKGSVGVTTTDEEVQYGKEKGIAIVRGNAEEIDQIVSLGNFEAIWANNFFEHILSPHAFLIKLKTISKDGTLLVLGVPVLPRFLSLLHIRKFRGALAVAHINFFTRNTLRLTAERAGWVVTDIRPFIFPWAPLDRFASLIAPHLYVVARNNINFRYHDKKLNEWKDDPKYRDMLTITQSI
jgi:SAM-dependent methyltransferase